jgi:anti-anti-sigma factor
MDCQAQEIANVVLVRVAGRIDHTTAKAFEDALLPLLNGCGGEGKKALLDLSGVVYMSSAGLRVLILAAKQCGK